MDTSSESLCKVGRQTCLSDVNQTSLLAYLVEYLLQTYGILFLDTRVWSHFQARTWLPSSYVRITMFRSRLVIVRL